MVGTTPAYDRADVTALRERLYGIRSRFITQTCYGRVVDLLALARVVAEIVDDHADQIIAERDALAEDLAWELNAARDTGRVSGGEVR